MTRYHVSLAGSTHEVVVQEGRVVSLDGQDVDATLESIEGTEARALRVGNAVSWLMAGRTGADEWDVELLGGRIRVEAIDDRTKTIRAMTGSSESAQRQTRLKAPMPGLVIDVIVSVGDSVRRGEPVAIVEAMKMENELGAPIDGTIAAVAVFPGDTVEKNQVLMELEPAEVGHDD